MVYELVPSFACLKWLVELILFNKEMTLNIVLHHESEELTQKKDGYFVNLWKICAMKDS